MNTLTPGTWNDVTPAGTYGEITLRTDAFNVPTFVCVKGDVSSRLVELALEPFCVKPVADLWNETQRGNVCAVEVAS